MSTYIMRRIIKEWFHGRADALCRQRTTWGLARLERRVMLAADGAVAAGESICQAMELCDAVDVAPMLVENSMHAIVFIDSSVPDMGVVTAELPADSEWIVLDPHGDGLQQITSVLARRTQVTAVHVVAHGESGKIRLGNRTVDEAALREMQDGLRGWAKSLTSDADILLYGCETGAGSVGARFVKVWSELTGADVAASTNRTGASRHGGDWALEQVAGNIETPVVVSAVLQSKYNHVLATQLYVYAAGQTGEEQITIWVNDTPYATWTLGGDPDRDYFSTPGSLIIPDGTTADQIRIEFLNDVYDPALGIDRNVRIDKIEIERINSNAAQPESAVETYETEATNVYSTGTWKSADGVTPGYRQDEWLHANGVFQYSTQAGAVKTDITIRAAGRYGTEELALVYDGSIAHTWSNIGTTLQDYTFTINAPSVTASKIGVGMLNQFNPLDPEFSELQVDSIKINGVVYQTESPDVFSIYNNPDAMNFQTSDLVVTGYRQSEILPRYGYFQFADPTTNGGSVITIEAHGIANQESQGRFYLGDEAMELQIDGVTVKRWENVSLFEREYRYVASGTVTPDRVRVVFTNDYYIPNVVDRNLIVDRIKIDNVFFETEAPNVFSTGTWLAADGVQPGLRQSEILHTYGYFQF